MLKGRIKSFGHAINGFTIALKEEPNLIIHFVAALAVIALGVLLEISFIEWMILVLVIGFVVSMELLNTALENLCDKITSENDAVIGKVKDIAAAAVLISAMTAVIIGFLIFAPKIWEILV